MNRTFIITGMLLLCFLSCDLQCAYAQEAVGIYFEKSDFKDAIVRALSERLEKEGYSVELHDISLLGTQSLAEYKVVVVLNKTKWLQINKDLKELLKNLNEQDKKRLVVLSTTGSKNKTVKIPGVDALTSASVMADVEQIVEQFFGVIKQKL